MSTNLLFEDDTDPVIWRGPIIAGIVKQFCSEVFWEDVDFMFIDMPPGTGDVPLNCIPVTSYRWNSYCFITSGTCKYDCRQSS